MASLPAIRLSLWLTLLLGAFAGCGSPGLPKPTGTSIVTLDETSRREVLSTRLNIELKMELPRPKAEGQVWQIIQNDTNYLVPLSELSPPAADTGRSTIRFQTARVGRTTLRFAAVPPGSTSAKPGDRYDIVVTITLPESSGPAPTK